jgi:acyl-coenzyme A synthetase/AMP-(fatty) acid ligase
MKSAGAVAREIQDSVKRSTAPYKYPREIHFVDELPKTVSGKIRRTELRGWLLDGRLPAGGASGVDGTGGGGTGGGAAG